MTGRLRVATTQLPAVKKGGAGKIVVMLSSVAKPAPAVTQPLKPATPSAVPAIPAATPSSTPAPAEPAKSSNLPPPGKPAPVESAKAESAPPPLPPQRIVPAKETRVLPENRLTSTTFVKLPPKTSVPQLSTLSGLPITPATPVAKQTPEAKLPPLTPPKKVAQQIPPIKLNEPSVQAGAPAESIFATGDLAKVSGTTPPADSPVKPPAMSPTSAPAEAKDKPAPTVAPALIPPQRLVNTGAAKSVLTTTPLPSALAKPSEAKLPEPKQLESKPVAPPGSHALHVAPPMLEQPPEPPEEKLPQPLLGSEPRKNEPGAGAPSAAVHKAPAMIPTESPSSGQTSLPQPLPPPKTSIAKATRNWLTKSIPLVLTATSKLKMPNVAEAKTSDAKVTDSKPALKPATLPRRALPNPDAGLVETPKAPEAGKPASETAKAPSPTKPAEVLAKTPELPKAPGEPSKISEPVKPVAEPAKAPEPGKPATEPAKSSEQTKPAATTAKAPETPKLDEKIILPAIAAGVVAAKESASPVTTAKTELTGKDKPDEKKALPVTAAAASTAPAVAKTSDAKKSVEKKADEKKHEPPPLPLTRAERAAKRHFWETVVFYILFAATVVALFLGGLHFGRDTRVEGQVIPPSGMKLNTEVWIVTDFSSLASGVADDLAKERTPLLQEIQERQDHVQRAQADIAARESRIRLIQGQINAARAEIESTVKESRDATQAVWDKEGADIDNEYAAKMQQLDDAIAARAKSLNLNYQPDPTFKSPEVWANAYRLALYQVPKGVDSLKEHQWLGDQMKQWRDYQKSLDDRQEQLREKAAQIKLGPAPKIADLNAKIDDLQQRIDSTNAEEVPLKAELQQAQIDLAASQGSVAGLDDKYYKQLDSLPQEAITKHIPLNPNGRFTWVEDDTFAQGETERHYWIFSRATRADGRQYWALHNFKIKPNETVELIIEPTGFVSTKSILRPDLTPDEQAQ
jgi:hypothetical protein